MSSARHLLKIRLTDSPRLIYCNGEPVNEVVHGKDGKRARNSEDFLEGYATAQEEWARRFGPLVGELERGLHEIAGFRSELLERIEGDIVELAMAVARKLMREEISEGRHRASAMIRGMLDGLELSAESGIHMKIRLHPDDHAEVLQATRGDEDGNEALTHIEFEPDDSMRRQT